MAAFLVWSEGQGSIAAVDEVRVHHSARFQSQDKATFLDVVQVQRPVIEAEPQPPQLAGSGVRQFRAHSRPLEKPGGGQAPVWYEASLSSARAEALLAQNEALRPGEKAAWTLSTFRQDGVLAALTARAVETVGRIDGVGVHCNNGFAARFGGAASSASWIAAAAQAWEDEAHFY